MDYFFNVFSIKKMKNFLTLVFAKMNGGIAFGMCLSMGSILTYVPQFVSIIRGKSVVGISEATLIILNMASMCLSMNSLIYSWPSFFCVTMDCISQILAFTTITISWLAVFIYYCIFIYYKFKNMEKRVTSGISYCLTYILFIIMIVTLSLAEKMEGNTYFFTIFEKVLGISSAVLYGLVYLPQIYTLCKAKSAGNNSVLMYALQTPGNLVLIFYLAIVNKNPITTWVTYLVTFTEQFIILCLLLYFSHLDKQKEENMRFVKEMEEEF